ncbi:MAG: hypothetical protein EPO24_09325 [Bacteroidetes bacterium]|nr:MAG: hypothetical protein EPO24_09325 [Bacteroidota bacterium]
MEFENRILSDTCDGGNSLTRFYEYNWSCSECGETETSYESNPPDCVNSCPFCGEHLTIDKPENAFYMMFDAKCLDCESDFVWDGKLKKWLVVDESEVEYE